MNIAYIGLGKMGCNMVERLVSKGHTVTAYDPDPTARERAEHVGATTLPSLAELLHAVPTPRTVWLMVPHGTVDAVLNDLEQYLVPSDTIIDGGNSPYTETIRRSAAFLERGIHYIDAGVSGGPRGALHGACIMAGGPKDVVQKYESLFTDLAVPHGYAYVGGCGAGHFVKMVHNGIEYGMMQALAEGFDLMRSAGFSEPLPLTKIADLYNHGSVVESRLVGWLLSGLTTYGENLEGISGSASASGEGTWTVETAKKIGVPVTVIEDSVTARTHSLENPSYQGQLISVMRNQFGGHDAHTK